MGADLLLVDGHIHTRDARHPIANAIAFAGGRVAALDGEALSDIFSIPPREILSLRVEQTIVAGKLIYAS